VSTNSREPLIRSGARSTARAGGVRALACIVLATCALAGPARADEQPIAQRVSAIVDAPRFKAARWGIHVVDVATGDVVYSRDAGRRFLPASNMKLYTTALALARLGPAYRWRTSVYAAAKPGRNGRIAGDLIVYGRGDPTFSARFGTAGAHARIDALADAVAATGARVVSGSLVADESFFKGVRLGYGWEWNDLQWAYGAEVSALSVGDNAIELTVVPGRKVGDACVVTVGDDAGYVRVINKTRTAPAGEKNSLGVYRAEGSNTVELWGRMPIGAAFDDPVAVHDPAGLFGRLLRDALARRNVVVRGAVKTVDSRMRDDVPLDTSRFVELAFTESEPLSAVVAVTNHVSQNLYAELLLRSVGRAFGPRDAESAEAAGTAVLLEYLKSAGIDIGPLAFSDGSGLSRSNLVTPEATVGLLTYVRGQSYGDLFFQSLPGPGSDGTMEKRFLDTMIVGKLRAKTGTLGDVSALSGYLETRSGRTLAFSIMVNNEPDDVKQLRRAIDDVVLALFDL